MIDAERLKRLATTTTARKAVESAAVSPNEISLLYLFAVFEAQILMLLPRVP